MGALNYNRYQLDIGDKVRYSFKLADDPFNDAEGVILDIVTGFNNIVFAKVKWEDGHVTSVNIANLLPREY